MQRALSHIPNLSPRDVGQSALSGRQFEKSLTTIGRHGSEHPEP